MTSLVVAGALANKAGQGGEAWVRLSWVRGLQRLGFAVTFVEQVDAASLPGGAVEYFRTVLRGFGIEGALVDGDGRVLAGLPLSDLGARLDDAAGLIDISGTLTTPSLRRRIRRAIFIDIDPGFTQFWALQGHLGDQLATYDDHVTIAERINDDGCALPTAGFRWRTVRQPVVLDDWPVTDGSFDRFTTVATWRSGFGRVTHEGRTFGLKLDEFRKVASLPRATGLPFELAVEIHPAEVDDLAMLDRHGWRLVPPSDVARSPDDFRRYVCGAGAEFSVAQGIYIETGSGWFSDRTVRYLAAGRPVLVQDTGFSTRLPVGEGLLCFADFDGACTGARTIVDEYPAHAAAARRVAETCFDSDIVLGRFCDELGLAP